MTDRSPESTPTASGDQLPDPGSADEESVPGSAGDEPVPGSADEESGPGSAGEESDPKSVGEGSVSGSAGEGSDAGSTGGASGGAPSTTVCPECSVGCHLHRGAGSRARGDAGPANPEGRLCARGVAAFERVDDDDRLTRPLVRRDGEHVAVPWDRALGRVVADLEGVLDAHGPDALAFLGAPRSTNEENYLLGKLARILGTNNVDNRARLCHAGTARTLSERLGWPATTNGLDDLSEADVVLVAGANPAERQPVAFNSFVRPAVREGTTLVHVDPVGNRTTRLADVHLAPRPGTDAVVFDLLAAAVREAGGLDREFVDRRTRGGDRFLARLSEFDREAALGVADVDPGALDRVAAELAGADRVAALVGTGLEGDDGGTDPPDALLDLLLSTGNVGRRGTGVHVLRGLVNEQGATDAGCVPDRLPGHQSVRDPAARERIGAAWGVEPPSTPGRDARELLGAFGDDVRGALLVGENPAVSKRSRGWVDERLEALDALVVLEVAPSETTPHADAVLPVAAGVEKAGTVTNLDRRVQRIHPTGRPPGEARPDFEVLCDLGRRLVGGEAFDYPGVGAAFEELARVAPTHSGLAYADLDDGGRRWPADAGPVLYRESFGTPDGRAPFGPPRSVVESEEGDGLTLVTGGRASETDPAPAEEVVGIHPADADRLGIRPGESVVVSNADASVAVTADPDEDVREGTVYMHAAVADPLLRSGGPEVAVESSPAKHNH